MKHLILVSLGLAAGSSTGVAAVAVYSIFDFTGALRQFTRDKHYEIRVKIAVLLGCVFSSVFHLMSLHVIDSNMLLVLVGCMQGFFVGMLIASLTDVSGILPAFTTKKFSLKACMMTMAVGRGFGSLYTFLVHLK
ncbi:MAG: stage V sporulation protein AB [Eubacteriaceae bacterium]|nr:stage V sporulation protein AB [Eubacteriaceae bacterium]